MAKVPVSPLGEKTKRKTSNPAPTGAIGTGTSITNLPTAELKARDRNVESPMRSLSRAPTEDDGSGPGPLPPGQIFHDFSKDRLGVFGHTRGSNASGTSEFAGRNIVTSSNTPIYTGDKLTPPSTWRDELVCYGIQVEPYSENHLFNSNNLAGSQWLRANTTVDTNVITATADGGTIRQTFSLGNAKPFVFSAYAECIEGTQAFEVSTNGADWLKIDVLHGDGPQRFALPTNSEAGSCWIRLYSAGDKIRIRYAQFEPSADGQPTSWIPTYESAPAARGRTIIDTPGTGDGATNNFSLQVTATALGDSSKHPEDGAPFFSLISTDYTSRLTAYHDKASQTVNLIWQQAGVPVTLAGPALSTTLNDQVDVRVRKSSDEGLVVSVNGTKAAFPSYVGFSDPPLKRLRIGGDADDTALHEFQWIRFDPTGDAQAEVDSWPTWTQPLPIITEEPKGFILGATPIQPAVITAGPDDKTYIPGGSVGFSVATTGDEPITATWTVNGLPITDTFPDATYPTDRSVNIPVVNAPFNIKAVASNLGGSDTSRLAQCTEDTGEEVLFDSRQYWADPESPDYQADWTSVDNGEVIEQFPWDAGVVIPGGFHAARSSKKYLPGGSLWHSTNQFPPTPGAHAGIEILDSNAATSTRRGVGKSLKIWRESVVTTSTVWQSDNILTWYAGDGTYHDQLYVEFYISVSPEMVLSFYGLGQDQNGEGPDGPGQYSLSMGLGKMFRILHWGGDQQQYFTFFGDENKPLHLWDIGGSDGTQGGYGVRNLHSFRCTGGSDISPQPYPLNANDTKGDYSLSYVSSTVGQAVGGGNPSLTNKKTGGTIPSENPSQDPIEIDAVLGSSAFDTPERKWTKMALFVKMNSAPGVRDGQMMQWVDDQRITRCDEIPWTKTGSPESLGFNVVGFGGNLFFSQYPDASRHEEWYAYDDIRVLTDIPSGLKE